MTIDRPRRAAVLAVSALAVAGLVAGLATVPGALASPALRAHSDASELTVVGDGEGGTELVTAPVGRSLERPGSVDAQDPAAVIARAHLTTIAPLWGVDDGSASLRATSTTDVDGVGPVVRFAQLVDGVPVYGGELVVSLDADGGLLSVGGETSDPETALDFTVPATRAAAVARTAAAAELDLPAKVLQVGTPSRYAYDPALLDEPAGPVRAVWRVVVVLPSSSAKAEVLVDATDASVVAVSGTTPHLRRGVCNAGADATAYGVDAAYGWCGEDDFARIRDTNKNRVVGDAGDTFENVLVPYARVEDGAAAGVADVDGAYASLGATSDLFALLGYDLTAGIAPTDASIGRAVGGSTKTLAGIVNYCDPVEAFYSQVPPGYTNAQAYDIAEYLAASDCPYENAYWYDYDWDWDPVTDGPYPGGQMFIGRGLASSEDVIGHELAHGVTAATSQLVYQGQAGAINESMSDVFGQLTQVFAAPGTDVAWRIGDELNGPILFGEVRSMSNPSSTALAEGNPQPDRMTSARWDPDPFDQDNGGVHANSGVGNKAAYLIARGGTFNNVVVRRLDAVNALDSQNASLKTARLYWVTQNLLPKNANYRRLAQTLLQACQQLVGQTFPGPVSGSYSYSAADCSQSVAKATLATEMSRSKATTTVSTTSIKYGKTVKVTARVTDLRGGSAGSVPVKLQALPYGASSFVTVASGTTSGGARTFTVKPTKSTYYRTVYSGGGAFAAVTGTSRKVTVTPAISRSVNRTTIGFGGKFKVTGSVQPNRAGKKVKLQQKVSGAWRTVKTVKLTRSSKFKVTYKPKSTADRYFRVYRPAESAYGAGASSRFKVKVR